MNKILLISPHFDDAVLSAGRLIAGRGGNVDVLTIFSAAPDYNSGYVTLYDRACGFNSSEDAMVVRAGEDREALAILNAHQIGGGLLDEQYRQKNDEVTIYDVAQVIREVIALQDYDFIIGPLGLKHPDHLLTYNGMIMASDNFPDIPFYVWEDLPHRVTNPELVEQRLHHEDPDIEREITFLGDGSLTDKLLALYSYKSQVARGDLNMHYMMVPERFHKIS